MHRRGDADRGLNRLSGDTRLAQLELVASMHMPQPLMAETASDHSSKSAFSTPGFPMTFMRSFAGIVL